MKKLICTLGLVTTALFFQNCGTNLQTTALADETNNEASLKPVVDDFIIAPSAGEVPVLAILSASTLKVRFDGRHGEYLVDLKAATATRGTAKANLPERLRLQFVQALSNAKLCEQDPKSIRTDLACTMIASQPYARLETKGSSMDLGAQTSGCTWVQDLCGKKRDQLRQAIKNFIVLNEELSAPY